MNEEIYNNVISILKTFIESGEIPYATLGVFISEDLEVALLEIDDIESNGDYYPLLSLLTSTEDTESCKFSPLYDVCAEIASKYS